MMDDRKLIFLPIDEMETRNCLHYVFGNVMEPQVKQEKNAISVHCVGKNKFNVYPSVDQLIRQSLDDSGRWPGKGVFAAISQRSKEPERQFVFFLLI